MDTFYFSYYSITDTKKDRGLDGRRLSTQEYRKSRAPSSKETRERAIPCCCMAFLFIG